MTILCQKFTLIFLCMRMIVPYFEWCNENKMLTWNKSYKNIKQYKLFHERCKRNTLLNELIFKNLFKVKYYCLSFDPNYIKEFFIVFYTLRSFIGFCLSLCYPRGKNVFIIFFQFPFWILISEYYNTKEKRLRAFFEEKRKKFCIQKVHPSNWKDFRKS